MHGGANEGLGPLSHRLQSEPGVPGQGVHRPSTLFSSHFWHANGVDAVSFGPGRHRGPSQVGGIGIIALRCCNMMHV